MALKERSHFLKIYWVVLLLLNGTVALVPSRTVAQTIPAARQQTKPLLEFRQQKQGTEAQLSRAFQQLRQLQEKQAQLRKFGDTQRQATIQTEINRLSQQIINLFEPATLTNFHVIDAYPEASNTQPMPIFFWSITVKFNAEGTKRFAELTKNVAGTGRAIGIFLKGELISAPVVPVEYATEGITGGAAVISGNFTAKQARDLAVQFRTQPVLTTEPDRSLRLGYERLHAQDYQGAIDYYTQAIKFGSKDPQTYLARAEAQIRLKNWQLALADYTQVIAFSPQNPNLYLQRARLYEELGQTQSAIADYEKVMQIDPKRFAPVVVRPLLMRYLELGDKPRSIAIVEQLFPVEMDKQLPILQWGRSSALCTLHSYFEDYDQTIQRCSQVLQLNPEDTRAAYLRGFAFEQTGKLQQAKRDYQQVLRIDPKEVLPAFFRTNPQDNPLFQNIRDKSLVSAYYFRGLAHYRLNDFRGAIADFNQALKLNPDYAPAYRDRGMVYKALGNLSAANQDFQSAAQRFKTQKNSLGFDSVLDLLPQKFPLTEL